MIRIRKKDIVLVLSGKDKGKRGEVVKVFPESQRALVTKVNFVKKHARPTQTEPGGIREKEAPIHVSKLMVVCPKCDKPTRPKSDRMTDGTKIRLCRNCSEMIAARS